ncbi:hypothetical protein VNI00_004225 [Paramarasmius palmivorus]|uniref:Uncharacterized protein n=1 Tax=Paramarasmius palmivorus TaxID=297713 RepID=A0AAW0DMB7_9AGAR
MKVKRESQADVENTPPKRPRRSCAQRFSYVKRDLNNAFDHQDFLESEVDGKYEEGARSGVKKSRETGEPLKERRVEGKLVRQEPPMPLMTDETVIILSLRVQLIRSEETITQLKSQLSDLADKHEKEVGYLKDEINRLKGLVSA